MSIKRRSLKMAQHERESLIRLYVENAIPVDQYEERQQALTDLCDAWNQVTGRTDTGPDVLHYMRSQRKQGKWVRLDGMHLKREAGLKLSAEEKELLVAIVHENMTLLQCGTDVIAYEPEFAALLAKEFAVATGRVVPAGDLIAEITAIRKRGLLPRIESLRTADEGEIGFGDIDQAVG